MALSHGRRPGHRTHRSGMSGTFRVTGAFLIRRPSGNSEVGLPARLCRGHLIVRWTPSATGATPAPSAATEALLTPHYTVIAVDNRGAGGSQRPLTGYDTATMAGDVAELATYLGFDQFRVAGEGWGAAIAYAVAAFHRPGCGNWCSRKRSCQDWRPAQDCQAADKTPRSPPTTSAPAGTSASSACRTCLSCCWPAGNGRSGRGTPDARCGTQAR